MTNQDAYLSAEQLFKAGRFAPARETAERCLADKPGHRQAVFLIGLIDRKEGKLPAALVRFAHAARLDPTFPDPHLLTGMILHQLGRLGEAADALRGCLALEPNRVQALSQLGRIFLDAGNVEAAESPIRRAIQLEPASVVSRIYLGDLYRLRGQLDESVQAYREATQVDPRSVDAMVRLGTALAQIGRATEAESTLRQAIGMNPNQPTARYNVAKILLDRRQLDEAAAQVQSALEIRPSYPDASALLGNLLGLAGRVPEAIAQQRRAISTKPDPGLASNLLLSLNYLDEILPAEVFKAHQEWAARFAPPVQSRRARAAPGRIRIGYVSPNFSTHSVAYFIEPILAAHDRNQLEIFCYADVQRPDEMTRRLQSLVEHWRPTTGLSTAKVVEQIKADRIDVLVDLAGHTAQNRLPAFAVGAAPVQMTYLGYPNTTGMSSMDFRITDAVCDPPDSTHPGTEQLIRIDGGMWAYDPPAVAPEVSPLPAITNGFVTFGSFNNLPKLTPAVLGCWGELLKRVPTSRLVLKSLGFAGNWGREYAMAHLTRSGVDPSRITLLHWTATTVEHLDLYRHIDIALDAFPYNGTTTTCESLWMGVPVVTFTGAVPAARVGASLLQCVGLADWIATDPAKYVELAIEKGADVQGLQRIRRNLRTAFQQSPLTDGRRVASQLETAFTKALSADRQV